MRRRSLTPVSRCATRSWPCGSRSSSSTCPTSSPGSPSAGTRSSRISPSAWSPASEPRATCSRSRRWWGVSVAADRREDRQAALRAALGAEGLDGLLVTHLPNIRYLTGFTGSAALLLVHAEATVLVTDFRYEVQAPAEAGDSARV